MSMHGKLGRFQVPEPANALARLHFHKPGKVALKTVDHEPKVAVLDQEDLLAQGIRCSQFIPGAQDVDALGSCTAQTSFEALSRILPWTQFALLVHLLVGILPTGYENTKTIEKAAIVFYHRCTDLTGQSGTEWPPTDGGSSGPYIELMAQQLKVISTAKIASGADSIVSLMQADGLLLGMPWFQSMFTPDASAFVDGNGSVSAIQAAINSGVAGGHEIYVSAIEKLVVLPTGHVDPFNTVLRLRNHWTASFGDHGSFRMHLSTLVALGSAVDLRQFIA